MTLTAAPYRLEALVGRQPAGAWVVLDEIQKIPALLDEVHRLMETRAWRFGLCGSSARKLKRGGADLLAGRAVTVNMGPFSSCELGDLYDWNQAMEWGLLPVVWRDLEGAPETLSAYVDTYLREEIRQEGAVRQYAPFVRFLTIAGQLNGQVLNAQNVAREAMVPRSSVDGYFSILQDTLLAHFLPAYRPNVKVREAAHPKFYWFDCGVARTTAGLLRDPLEKAWKGFAFEALLYSEMRLYNEVSGKHRAISYYRTAAGTEIDFIVETRKSQCGLPPEVVCIELKLATRWNPSWERSMRDLARQPGIHVKRMIGVYTGARVIHDTGVDVYPADEFMRKLHAGEIF